MRYLDVVERFAGVLTSSSREWAVTDTLVMCTELDLSAMWAAARRVPAHSERQPKGPMFLRVTLFRRRDEAWVRHDQWSSHQDPLTSRELDLLAIHQGVVDDWVAGRCNELPPSTSTSIADRIRHPG